MPVARVLAADAAREVDERASVDVGDPRALGLGDDEAGSRDPGRHEPRPLGSDSSRLRPLRDGHRAIMHLLEREFTVWTQQTTALR
jgi:hypothetical protein